MDNLHFSKFQVIEDNHNFQDRGIMHDSYRRKYVALKRKCDSIEMSNERVLNRLYHVKKYIHKLSRERRGLAKKLTELGDEFKKSDFTIPLEDEPPISGVSESPSSSGLPGTGEGSDLLSPSGMGGVQLKFEDAPLPDQPSTTGPSKPSKKKRSREVGKSDKEKDPNAPKKPANAFLMYCQEERQKVQDGEGNGIYSADLSHQDLTRQLAKQWKFLSEEEKRHYYLLYEKEKDRYDKAVKKYAKGGGGGEKKSVKREEADSETIDVVKTGHEQDGKKKEFKEEKVTLKSSGNEDQNVDVEKDEFEFIDNPIIVDEPKICLEKIDKSKLFDKSRLFTLPSPPSSHRHDAEPKGIQVKDLLMKPEMGLPPRMSAMDFKGPSILEIKTGHRLEAPSMSQMFPRMTPPPQMRPQMRPPQMQMGPPQMGPSELTIKELVGMRPSGSFEMTNPQMMELKSKASMEDRTVLASALRNKPMFEIKSRSDSSLPKSPGSMPRSPGNMPRSPVSSAVGPQGDASEVRITLPQEARNKISVEMRSRLSADMRPKSLPDPKPRLVGEVKVKTIAEVTKTKPAAMENRSISVPDGKPKPSPEMRRMSMDNKRPVVELRKIIVDPSDDPYHFDD